MLKPVLASLLFLQAGSLAARLDVRAHGDSVSVDARAVPLWLILDRLAQQTGMRVSYEGAKPAALVTTAFETASATELLVRLMEGQGLVYAFQTDATGRQVQRLLVGEVIAAPKGVTAAGDRRPPPLPAASRAPAWSEINDDDANDLAAEAEAMPSTSIPMNPAVPAFPSQAPGSVQFPGGIQLPGGVQLPGAIQLPGPVPLPGTPYVLPEGIAIPTFPGAASLPMPAGTPPPPTFPEGASEPIHR